MNCCQDESIRESGFKLRFFFCEACKWFNKSDIQITLVKYVPTQIPFLCTSHLYAKIFTIPSKINVKVSIHGEDLSHLSNKSFSFSVLISISFFWQTSGLLRTVIGPVVSVTKRPQWNKTIQFFRFLLPSQNIPLASFPGCAYGRNIMFKHCPKVNSYGHKSFQSPVALSWCL